MGGLNCGKWGHNSLTAIKNVLHDSKNLNLLLSLSFFPLLFLLSSLFHLLLSLIVRIKVFAYVVAVVDVLLVLCCVLALLCWPKVRVFHVALGNQLPSRFDLLH